MDLDLRLLRYFVTVAEVLHFNRAARRLHVSQPALSSQIRKLERDLGVELFRRSSRRVQLTPAGEMLLEQARLTLAAAERALAVARDAARGQVGHLTVGFIANAAAELTPLILRTFEERHPRVTVEMRQFDFTDPLAGLEEEEVDVAFLRPPLPDHDWLEAETVFEEPRVLILSSGHRLAGQSAVPIEALLDEPFVARNSPSVWRDFWLGVPQRHDHPVKVAREVSTVDECLETILAGHGMAFTQKSSERFYARPGVAFVDVPGLSGTSVSVAWRRDAAGPLVHAFVRTTSEVARASEHELAGVGASVRDRAPAGDRAGAP